MPINQHLLNAHNLQKSLTIVWLCGFFTFKKRKAHNIGQKRGVNILLFFLTLFLRMST
jgi:hypothetical protein